MTKASVRVMKIGAAQRLLDAAVRMAFAEEDPFAITIVAASACQVLRDLKTKRGGSVLADEERDRFVAIATMYARGELAQSVIEELKARPEWPAYVYLSEEIKKLGPDTPFSELQQLMEVTFTGPGARKYEGKHWKKVNEPASFLKHANTDPDATLAEDQADPTSFITAGCILYLDLARRLTPEMNVWCAHEFYVKGGDALPRNRLFRRIAEVLLSVKSGARNAAARELISSMKRVSRKR